VPSDLPGQFAGFANPTAQIGLSAVNGVATTAMRSDAAPALDQSIVPTWTGLHTFNAGQRVSSSQAVEFGWSVAGKQADAGKIGYQTFSTALDIVGAGTGGSNRAIKLWDNTWIAGYIGTETYTSQTTGWRIDSAGGGDFRYLFTDEMHAKSFIADLEQALAGGQIISKSVAMLGKPFTAPAAGGSTTLWPRDLPSAPDMAVFQSGDIVRIRTFSRSAGSLSISDCWGVVTSYADGSGADSGLQSWTFTRSASPNAGAMASGTVVPVDAIVLDYGVSGNGIWETNAIDGAYGVNSPYTQAVQWTGHPATGSVVRYRAGKLDGWGSGYAGTNTFGFVAGNASGVWVATEATNGFRIMYGANPVAQVDTSGSFLFRGAPSASVNVGALRWNPSSYILEGGYYAPAAGPSYGAYTQQWRTDASTGAILVGGGNVRLDAAGITVNYSGVFGDAIKFLWGGTSLGSINATLSGSDVDVQIKTGYPGGQRKVSFDAGFVQAPAIVVPGSAAIKHTVTQRNYFTDYETVLSGLGGYGLRVGGAWGRYGIYAEDGDLALGSLSGSIYCAANIDLTANSRTIYSNNWFRSVGDSGWYSETYGGGWYMTDTTWIRAYNSKSIWTPSVMQADGGFKRGGAAGGIYVPVTPFLLTDMGGYTYNATAGRATGTYTATLNANGNSIPAGAKAISVLIGAYWSGTSNTYYMYLDEGSGSPNLIVRAATTLYQENAGIVNINVNHQVAIVVAGTTANNPYIRVLGYFY
jgi:hypothetical protein